jgi:opacity protein-like surface antigen
MKQLLTILTASIFLMGSAAFAQEEVNNTSGSPQFSHAFYANTGYANYDLGELDAFLPNGAPQPVNHFSGLGIGVQHQIKGVMISLSGERNKTVDGIPVVGNNAAENDNYEVDGRSFKGMFKVGYAVVNNSNFRIFPMVGAGLQRFTMEITRNEDFSPSDIDNSEMTGSEFNFQQKNFVGEVSVGADYIFGQKNDEGSTKGMMLGLRAGYHYALANDNWQHGGGDVNNAPDFGTRGFYGKVVLGFGGTSNKMPSCKKWCGK